MGGRRHQGIGKHGMRINDFLAKYRRVNAFGLNETRPRVRCADGYTVSVQAGDGIYSMPRMDAGFYSHVELGFPNMIDETIINWAEDPKKPKNTVYGFVPVDVVDTLFVNHGGIVGADFSNVRKEDWQDE